MRAVWLALALAALALPGQGEVGADAGAVFQVDFSHPGLSPSHWTLTIRPDGSGHFRSERRSPTSEGSQGEAQAQTQGIEAPSVDRDIQVSAGFAERVFQTARRHKSSKSECESHLKVAFQGQKKLQLSGPDGGWVCEFNYSQDKEIQALGDSLVAVAGTIVEGARLEVLMQHDRLGLDSETEYLVEAVGSGRLEQVCTIRGILERLANDPAVMERVRKRARVLLAGTGTEEK
jgi:hypothetical protein